ncbi:hypothetical protein CHS0354_027315 [Potamilus streckersoni]|uniref:Peptidase S1 domain-containing protein n=1 Tax=Potamilus streckersoni TaxID=2493646 RepID=A0AAE0VQ14_9BIVA|nr:hypothetical protein CHS0354_027315 [Potamilus streckersoni]
MQGIELSFLYFLSAFLAAGNSVKDFPTSMISGGQNVFPHDFPWQASIQFHTGHHFCGGALIDSYWLLTAAHCMEQHQPNQIRVVLGEHTLSEIEGTEQYRNISRIVISPFFNVVRPEYNYYMPYDLALLELTTPANLNSFVKPISLPDPNKSYSGRSCILTGWGNTGVNADGADVLQMAEIKTLENRVCGDTWGYYIYYGNICVYTYGVAPCQGDSGGPLMCLDNNGYVLAGISSWDDTDCKDHPSIYTRVTENLGWINDVIDNDGHN